MVVQIQVVDELAAKLSKKRNGLAVITKEVKSIEFELQHAQNVLVIQKTTDKMNKIIKGLENAANGDLGYELVEGTCLIFFLLLLLHYYYYNRG